MDYQKTLNSFDFQTNQEPTTEESRTATELGIKSPEMPTLNGKTLKALEDLRNPMLMAYRGELEAIDRMGGSEASIFCGNTHGEDSELISFNDSQRKITCTGKPIGWNFGAGGGSIGGSSHSENHTYSLDNVCRYFNNTKLNGRARLYQKVFGEFVNPDYSRVFYRDGECIGVKKY